MKISYLKIRAVNRHLLLEIGFLAALLWVYLKSIPSIFKNFK